jgi:ABC-type Fe3+-hydroxamate transport system substrate-binding protein
MRLLLSVLTFLAFAACERSSPFSTDSKDELRIVSLSPAISRTLVDFDLGDRIVGRTPFCASLDQSIPVVGSLLDLDYERLLKLDPTHVLVQPSLAQGIEPRLRELAASNGWTIGEFKSLNTIDDVEAMILALPALLFADGTPARRDAAARAADLVTQIANALTPAGDDAWKGTTLLVAGIDPVFVFGRETYLSDVLAALGGTNAAHVTGWAELSLEDIVRLDPEAIILVRETAAHAASSEPRPQGSGERDDAPALAAALGPLAELPIRAVNDGRVAVLAHADANLPSSGVVGVAGALREILISLEQVEVER